MTARSRSGYVIFLCGCPVTWKSQLQSSISLSTQEAEYNAFSQSVRTLLPIQNLSSEAVTHFTFRPGLAPPSIYTVMYENNNGALSLALNQRLTSRTKYYHVNSHWFWEHVKNGTFAVKKVASNQQNADDLTKPLPLACFETNQTIVQCF